jgi:hypothetical protein
MPIELQIIRCSEFIRLNPRDLLDFDATRQALWDLASACLKRGLDAALLDVRTIPIPAKPRFTPTQLAALVSTFREAGLTRRQRLAVLYRVDVHGGIRNFAFIGRMRGLDVQAFTDFEAAFDWLSQARGAYLEQHQGEIPVPIAQGQSGTKKRPLSVPIQQTGAPGRSGDAHNRKRLH